MARFIIALLVLLTTVHSVQCSRCTDCVSNRKIFIVVSKNESLCSTWSNYRSRAEYREVLVLINKSAKCGMYEELGWIRVDPPTEATNVSTGHFVPPVNSTTVIPTEIAPILTTPLIAFPDSSAATFASVSHQQESYSLKEDSESKTETGNQTDRVFQSADELGERSVTGSTTVHYEPAYSSGNISTQARPSSGIKAADYGYLHEFGPSTSASLTLMTESVFDDVKDITPNGTHTGSLRETSSETTQISRPLKAPEFTHEEEGSSNDPERVVDMSTGQFTTKRSLGNATAVENKNPQATIPDFSATSIPVSRQQESYSLKEDSESKTETGNQTERVFQSSDELDERSVTGSTTLHYEPAYSSGNISVQARPSSGIKAADYGYLHEFGPSTSASLTLMTESVFDDVNDITPNGTHTGSLRETSSETTQISRLLKAPEFTHEEEGSSNDPEHVVDMSTGQFTTKRSLGNATAAEHDIQQGSIANSSSHGEKYVGVSEAKNFNLTSLVLRRAESPLMPLNAFEKDIADIEYKRKICATLQRLRNLIKRRPTRVEQGILAFAVLNPMLYKTNPCEGFDI